MAEQNLKNHARIVPFFHYGVYFLLAACLGGSIVNLVHADHATHYSAALLLILTFTAVLITWYTRSFALKAQDRAIRAEENFRHYLLTGKPFDERLRMRQIIALRFASDAEMPALAKRAAEEGLDNKTIKAAIVNWRADNNRV